MVLITALLLNGWSNERGGSAAAAECENTPAHCDWLTGSCITVFLQGLQIDWRFPLIPFREAATFMRMFITHSWSTASPWSISIWMQLAYNSNYSVWIKVVWRNLKCPTGDWGLWQQKPLSQQNVQVISKAMECSLRKRKVPFAHCGLRPRVVRRPCSPV